jgi:hypothetical protein
MDDVNDMDASGARHLAARIRAGVRVGQFVEVVGHDGVDQLRVGDRGVVRDIDQDGSVLVAWERGFSLAVDPAATILRPA